MVNVEHDVVIVGAGPAGSMAAYELAKNGISTLIIDKARLPRYKTCGGGLVFRARKILPFELENLIEREFSEVQIVMNKKKTELFVNRDFPLISMVSRENFDYFLLKKAKEAGANLFENEDILDIQILTDKCNLITTNYSITSKFIIGADGVYSKVAKLCRFEDSRYLIPSIESEIIVDGITFKRLSKHVRFDIGFISDGYGWVFPKQNHLSVGLLSTSRKKINFKEIYKEYLFKLGIDHVLNEEFHGWQIPIRPRNQFVAYERVLLTGDAAGFADPITMEGISNALFSGKLAAESIIESKFDVNKVGGKYNFKLSQKLIPGLRKSWILSRIFYHYPVIRNIMFRIAGKYAAEKIADSFSN